ncbi:MAG: hypothetical protein Q4F43_10545, partial [Eubacteriales bacterium]|nr:hypothetical protein [Eubacteriales bacterium]
LKGIASEAGPSFCSGLLASLQGEGVPAQTAEGEGNSTASGSGRQRGEIPFLTGKKKEDSPSSIEGFLKTRPSRGSGGEETEGHSTPEDPAADNPFFRVMETQTPEQQAKLPVPPMLYDFTIRFPAGRISMAQETGQKLFPGFANYGFYEPVPDKVDTDHTEMIPASNRKEETGAEEKAEKDRTHSRTKGREAEEEPATGEEKSRRLVLIGDSRTVGMQMTVPTEGEVYWSAANSMGYSWMVSTGVPAVDDLIGEDTDVAILMGVNDLGNVGKYAQYINEKAAEWKARGARTFFVSVTPVDDSRSPNAKNARIESFNSYMQENLQDAVYIDAYSRIRNTYQSPDGIHYASSTYREIYRIIRYYAFRGWYEEAGLWFYFDSGRPRTGWQYLDGRWQYFDGNGVRWIRDGWVGDMWIAPYPEIGMVNPYDAVRH